MGHGVGWSDEFLQLSLYAKLRGMTEHNEMFAHLMFPNKNL